MARSRPTYRAPGTVFALSVLLLFLLLRVPSRPDEIALDRLAHWPLEIPLAVLLLVALPVRLAAALRVALVGGLLALVLLRLADLGSRFAFGRAFSPLAEWHLVGQGWSLASDAAGRGEALAVLAAVSLALVALATLLHRGLARGDAFSPARRRRIGRTMLVSLALGGAAWALPLAGGPDLGVRADVAAELAERIERTRRAVDDQKAFSTALAVDPLDARPPPTFAALGDRDVIVLFVESYGRSWLDAPRFADSSRASLDALAETIAGAGLSVASGWVDSPVRGGRSWLAQATFASGLPLTNHARFDRLIASDRPSLHALFGAAGRRTAAVLPIVDGEWTEGAWYRPERFVDGPALGYAGRGFGYVTMPDQYTLAAFERTVRAPWEDPSSRTVHTARDEVSPLGPRRVRGDARPLFATVGLLGSHAPWTPLALPVPWEDIDDGRVFDGSRRVGGPLSWSDPDRVRESYGRSLELTLARVGEYLARYADDALVVILGDHQPADIVAGWAPNAHVPMHVVARAPELLSRLPREHFAAGTVPDAAAPALPMAGVRELLATAFETSDAGGADPIALGGEPGAPDGEGRRASSP